MMLESSGEITPPWGEPLSGCVTLPSSMTPAFNQARIRRRTLTSSIGDPFCYRQPEPCAAGFASGGIDAEEPFEDTGQQVLRYPVPIVSNGYDGLRPFLLDRRFDPAARGRVLDGVVKQRPEQPAQARAVPADRNRSVSDGENERLPFGFGKR